MRQDPVRLGVKCGSKLGCCAAEHLVRKKREISGDLEGHTPLIAPLSSPGVGKADGTLTMREVEFAKTSGDRRSRAANSRS